MARVQEKESDNLARLQEKERDNHTRIHERERDNLSKLLISNAENLDKSVLTYSGAALGLSLSFLKDFVPIRDAKWAWSLYCSWWSFALAIVLVIASYVVSQKVVKLQFERAERYYEDGQNDARDEHTWIEKVADHLNGWMYAAAFVIGLSLTILFVSINLSGAKMANKNEKLQGLTICQEGFTPPKMQRVERGLTGGKLQPVNPGAPKQPTAQPPSGNSSQNKK
ncbi:hypothetical protein [Paraburkholderia sp. SIMBA_027]|uniref:hypothetical protein n=1 Tax=Paraburkholderia sp. SIMBA_027 TaxID=3085770 RepID=UPI003979CAFE